MRTHLLGSCGSSAGAADHRPHLRHEARRVGKARRTDRRRADHHRHPARARQPLREFEPGREADPLRLRALAGPRIPLRGSHRLPECADAEDFVERGVVSPTERRSSLVGSPDRRLHAARPRRSSTESRSDLGLAPDAFVVTMISRVTRTKGVLDFAAAAKKIRATGRRSSSCSPGPPTARASTP